MGVGWAQNFIRLRVESFSLQRQQKKKKIGISQSLYKRKVVKGELCMGLEDQPSGSTPLGRGSGRRPGALGGARPFPQVTGRCGETETAGGGGPEAGAVDTGRLSPLPCPCPPQPAHFHPPPLGDC